MNKISELTKILSHYFSWNKSRLDCLVRMLLALFTVRTVSLSEIAVAFTSAAEVSSRYKRLPRFFKQFTLDYTVIARWGVLAILFGQKILSHGGQNQRVLGKSENKYSHAGDCLRRRRYSADVEFIEQGRQCQCLYDEKHPINTICKILGITKPPLYKYLKSREKSLITV